MTGGSASRSSGVLSRANELERLKAAQGALHGKLNEAAQQQAALERQLQQQTQENQALESDLAKKDDEEFIKDLARDQLGLAEAGERIFYDVND